MQRYQKLSCFVSDNGADLFISATIQSEVSSILQSLFILLLLLTFLSSHHHHSDPVKPSCLPVMFSFAWPDASQWTSVPAELPLTFPPSLPAQRGAASLPNKYKSKLRQVRSMQRGSELLM